jgi:hypothetical protein
MTARVQHSYSESIERPEKKVRLPLERALLPERGVHQQEHKSTRTQSQELAWTKRLRQSDREVLGSEWIILSPAF